MGDRKKSKKHDSHPQKISKPPVYDGPPPWIPPQERWNHTNYNSNLITFLPRFITLERIEDRPLGFNIRGGPISEYGVFVSKVNIVH